ncbi:hypothetical protein Bca52824_001358 [Brassica carinata]|uniref:Uncharacterized protein n=1 Tax=Brassica carinata TaxID=52824 RepID=A0A8X7WLD1_BRACI|nr:hypothetical protein Bca52824_001358 [Brassica carinata]
MLSNRSCSPVQPSSGRLSSRPGTSPSPSHPGPLSSSYSFPDRVNEAGPSVPVMPLVPTGFGILACPTRSSHALDAATPRPSLPGLLSPPGLAPALLRPLTAEHRERFTPATQEDPDPYSRAEMDDKLNDIYTIHYDSMNDFKWKLDSVYHPLNDKIKYLTQTMENLPEDVNTLRRRIPQGAAAWKQWKLSTSHEFPHHTSANERWTHRPTLILHRSIVTKGNQSTYALPDWKRKSRMDAFQQEMGTIQSQLDFHLKISPSTDMPTSTSIDPDQEPAEHQKESIDSKDNTSLDTYLKEDSTP